MQDILKRYKKLSGSGQKKGSFLTLSGIRSRLFLGEDHLLFILSNTYEEEYRRFYFKDIQALITLLNRRFLLWNIIFGIMAVVVLPVSTDLWPLSVFFAFLLFMNWLRGPTCTCHIQTAVSREELPSLHRIKNTRKVLNQIIPFIEREQGRLQDGDIASKIEEFSSEAAKTGPRPGAHTKPTCSGKVHKALYALLLLSSLTIGLDLFFNSVPTTLISSLISSALIIMVIVALVQQHGSSLRRELQKLTWTTMVYLLIYMAIGYGALVFFIMQDPGIANNQWEIVRKMSSVSAFDYPFFLWTYIVAIIFSSAAGAAGILFLRRPVKT